VRDTVSAAPAPFRYRAFGVTIGANQPVAGLAIDGEHRVPDVTLIVRHTRESSASELQREVLLGNPALHPTGGIVLKVSREQPGDTHVLEHGSGLVCRVDREGRTLTIDWPERLTEDPWEFVLGFASAYLLRRRGVVCLHAAAVESDGEAILLAGPPAAGKSTLAAAVIARGCRLLTDDVAALTEGKSVRVNPGPATLRPRAAVLDTLRALSSGRAWWSPSAEPGCVEIDPIARAAYSGTTAIRVARVLMLNPRANHGPVSVDAMDPAEAAVALMRDAWGARFDDPAMRAREFDQVTRMLAGTSASRLTYDTQDAGWLRDALPVFDAWAERVPQVSQRP
jgi:hypothetical protein